MNFEEKRQFIRRQRAEGYKDKSVEELSALKTETSPSEKIEIDAIDIAITRQGES